MTASRHPKRSPSHDNDSRKGSRDAITAEADHYYDTTKPAEAEQSDLSTPLLLSDLGNASSTATCHEWPQIFDAGRLLPGCARPRV